MLPDVILVGGLKSLTFYSTGMTFTIGKACKTVFKLGYRLGGVEWQL
jgi:hypothetical protein